MQRPLLMNTHLKLFPLARHCRRVTTLHVESGLSRHNASAHRLGRTPRPAMTCSLHRLSYRTGHCAQADDTRTHVHYTTYVHYTAHVHYTAGRLQLEQLEQLPKQSHAGLFPHEALPHPKAIALS